MTLTELVRLVRKKADADRAYYTTYQSVLKRYGGFVTGPDEHRAIQDEMTRDYGHLMAETIAARNDLETAINQTTSADFDALLKMAEKAEVE